MTESIIYQFSVNDTRPRIEYDIAVSGDKFPIDVDFDIENSDGDAISTSGDSKNTDINQMDKLHTTLVYTPASSDFSEADTYRGEFEVTYSDGGHETFPKGVPITFQVAPDIG